MCEWFAWQLSHLNGSDNAWVASVDPVAACRKRLELDGNATASARERMPPSVEVPGSPKAVF